MTVRISARDGAQSVDIARQIAEALRSVTPASGTSLEWVPAPRTPIGHEPALRIDVASRTVRSRGAAVELTRLEFDLLLHLARHPGRVFRRTTLLTDVWQLADLSRTRTVDVHVRRLRSKLADQGLIGTVQRVGYRLAQDADIAVVEQHV